MEASNPYAPPSAPVRDIAEGTGFALAGRWARLGAALLDGIIGGLITYVPALFFIDFAALARTGSSPEEIMAVFGRVMLALLPGFAIYLAITIWLEIRNRQTIGKSLVGIKVARSNGDRVGLGRLFWMRNVLIGLLTAIPFVGPVLALVDHLLIFRQSRQCLHDQIADTIVIQA